MTKSLPWSDPDSDPFADIQELMKRAHEKGMGPPGLVVIQFPEHEPQDKEGEE